MVPADPNKGLCSNFPISSHYTKKDTEKWSRNSRANEGPPPPELPGLTSRQLDSLTMKAVDEPMVTQNKQDKTNFETRIKLCVNSSPSSPLPLPCVQYFP